MPKINDHKHAWTERIGDECRANDIPFFLELVGYKEGVDEKGPEYAKLKPEVVAKSMEEFTKDRYGVDVLKVRDSGQPAVRGGRQVVQGHLRSYTKAEALDHFRVAADGDQQAVHLSVGRREQSRVHRGPGVRRGGRREVQRRALRTRHLERRHSDLRREGRKAFSRRGWRTRA